MEKIMLDNVLKKFPVIPIVDFVHQDDGKCKGFYLVLSTNSFPIVEMDKALDINDFRKFWRLMGYQVSEIEEKSVSEWTSEVPSWSPIMKDFKGFNNDLGRLSSKTIDIINKKSNSTDELSAEEAELASEDINSVFRKFIVSYKLFSNIMFFEPKRLNVIKKGKIEFIVRKEDVDKIRDFYEENKVNYSTASAKPEDLVPYLKHKTL